MNLSFLNGAALWWRADATEDLSDLVPGASVLIDQTGNGNHGIFVPRAVTDKERRKIQIYFARKYGIFVSALFDDFAEQFAPPDQ